MENPHATPSQTLSRGLIVLETIAEADNAPSIRELAERLGLHRSIIYRIVRTLEDHNLVVRDMSGGLEPGPRLAALALNVSRDLQGACLPELTAIAADLGMTAFLVTLDPDNNEAVTLASVEPRHSAAAVAQHPGSRHSITRGAPGRAIGGQVGIRPPARFEVSSGEVIAGLSSIAIPLVIPGQRPAALATVYLSESLPTEEVVQRLERSAISIRKSLIGRSNDGGVPASPRSADGTQAAGDRVHSVSLS